MLHGGGSRGIPPTHPPTRAIRPPPPSIHLPTSTHLELGAQLFGVPVRPQVQLVQVGGHPRRRRHQQLLLCLPLLPSCSRVEKGGWGEGGSVQQHRQADTTSFTSALRTSCSLWVRAAAPGQGKKSRWMVRAEQLRRGAGGAPLPLPACWHTLPPDPTRPPVAKATMRSLLTL
jgi:hypothetical protein